MADVKITKEQAEAEVERLRREVFATEKRVAALKARQMRYAEQVRLWAKEKEANNG